MSEASGAGRPGRGAPAAGAASAAGGADEPPPVLGRWSALYAVVIGVLVVAIVLLGWLTRAWK